MARSKFNVITHGLSGLVGDMIVFRQRANKTIVSGKPKPSSKAPTTLALAVRARFKRAAIYATSVMEDPTLKAAYQALAKLGQSAFNVAFADYQRGPEFYEEVDLTGYSGAVGQEITVSAMDDFRVERVQVEIRSAEDILLESGDAVQAPNELDWVYTTTAVNSDLPGTRFKFTATDVPGNKTVLEKVLD